MVSIERMPTNVASNQINSSSKRFSPNYNRSFMG